MLRGFFYLSIELFNENSNFGGWGSLELQPLAWLLQTVPEALAVASLAVALGIGRLTGKSILIIGLPLAVSVYLVRLMPLIFGVHFIIFIVILAALLTVRLKHRFNRCLLTALVACVILAVSETAFLYLMSLITGVTADQVTLDSNFPYYYIWPHTVFLFLLALAVNRWHKKRREKGGEIDARVSGTERCGKAG
jgi:small-conductance mechanosensitive channel